MVGWLFCATRGCCWYKCWQVLGEALRQRLGSPSVPLGHKYHVCCHACNTERLSHVRDTCWCITILHVGSVGLKFESSKFFLEFKFVVDVVDIKSAKTKLQHKYGWLPPWKCEELGKTETIRNYILQEIKNILNVGNSWWHTVQNLFSWTLSTKIKFKHTELRFI